ncbi:MAG: UDP-N-acetylglucosamine 1-carboxyvinyltransferase [Firmicutes bacterium]|nr:UDP-N-acetylglucosamine 1-carboxyvinyltransferase [Bacillota bacterium]MCL5039921.1 UDP-N-acetylglucosamine 1-carboxyvinyltransferase [Bacillota bacterium]
MEVMQIEGGRRLLGRVKIAGAKNSALPIMAATLLTSENVYLQETPPLEDVRTMVAVLESLGSQVSYSSETSLCLCSRRPLSPEAPYDLIRKMRASFLVLGPLLARYGKARLSLPGGCAIGTRPIDLHLKGLAALGGKVEFGHGFVQVEARELRGSRIYLDYPSVGATENIMMAATLARGRTIIENAAEEPEIIDLANFLNTIGALVKGAGTKLIRIEGVPALGGGAHTVIPDRIEAGTYLVAAALTEGDVLVENVIIEHLKPLVAKLREAGVRVFEEDGTGVRVLMEGRPEPVDVKTLPYPGFPTDMQAQMMAFLALAEGTSLITETVFENRFMHVDELRRMGANIKIEGRTAIVKGAKRLMGAQVKATDLRAGAALVLAGLAAEGQTQVARLDHLDRGYVGLVEKLAALGANIRRVEEE